MPETSYTLEYFLDFEDGTRIHEYIENFPNSQAGDPSVGKAVRDRVPRFDEAIHAVFTIWQAPNPGSSPQSSIEVSKFSMALYRAQLDK